jgi:hypothetical protein
MSDRSEEMPDQFYETVNKFLSVAEAFEADLSIDQIHSAFLYASSCYSAKHFSAMCAERGLTVDAEIQETVDIYREMLENGIRHYGPTIGS